MNLARVLQQSADEVPAPVLRLGPPRLHPNLVVREHRERDDVVIKALIPGGRPPHYFRFNQFQWRLTNLFNGQRTVEDVVRYALVHWKVQLNPDDIHRYVQALEENSFWYHTPQEESVALCEDLMHKRQRRARREAESDLSRVILYSFNPNRLMTFVESHFQWVYSRWFTYWSLFMLAVALVILGSHWNQVWTDSVEYYRLTGRGFGHFLNFLAIFVVLATVHESAHGLTCKHYGGNVHRMGFLLIYGVPCVFCDVSEVWVYGGRWERMATIFAGVWSEIVICTYAAVLWWATPPGTFLHEIAYITLLAGGIFCVMLNWNPLSKMDGYMLLTEFLRMNDVKVISTKWLLAWMRKHIFHLPATVPPVTRRRAVAYSIYAILAGAYSYFLLLFFARICYHIVYFYTPQWAFVPAGLLALRMFRSRIINLGKFMKELYLDKRELLRARRLPIAVAAALVLLLGLLPLRRETVQESFVLEPVQRAVLRAQVPGRVVALGAGEGQRVHAGQVIARLHNLNLESQTASAAADYHTAEARVFSSQLQYTDFASAQARLRDAQTQLQLAAGEDRQLTLASPIAGLVVTPRVHDLLGTYVAEGTVIAEVADLSSLRARIFVPDNEMRKLQHIHDVAIRPDGSWRSVSGKVLSISPASQELEGGLVAGSGYQGVGVPDYFVLTVAVANPAGQFRDGMTGTAKIRGPRRGLLLTMLDPVFDAFMRRFW